MYYTMLKTALRCCSCPDGILESSGSEDETTWVPGTAAAGGAHARLGQRASALRLSTAMRTAWFGIHICAGLDLAGPDSDGEGAGAAAQDDTGAIIGLLQGQDDATVHPDKGDAEEVVRKLFWQLAARVVLARQRKNRSI